MSALDRELACIASRRAAYRAALADVCDELDEIDRELARLRHRRAQVVERFEQPLCGLAVIEVEIMSWIWPDEPYAEPLPYYAVGVCDECWRPADELVEGLGECCRCHSCGEPAAPVEHRGARLCRSCAVDSVWAQPVTLALEDAE